jgi:hypothetical protein
MPAGPYNEARRAFLHGDLKMIVASGTQREVFDLAADPAETHDLSSTSRAREIAPYYDAVIARLREIKVTGTRK